MLPEHLVGRRIGILGFGRNHQALLGWLVRHGVSALTVFDESPDAEVRVREAGFAVPVVAGPTAFASLDADVLFRSPGIPRHRSELVDAEAQGAYLTSQTELFLEVCPALTVGVTGTKGKSTTSALTAHLISASGRRCYLAGNIGKDPFEFLDELSADDVVVLELSSFQLDGLRLSPRVGIVVGVTVDHLDHHRSVAEYHAAKATIVVNQGADGIAILNADDPVSASYATGLRGQTLYFSVTRPVTAGCALSGESFQWYVPGEEPRTIATVADVPLLGTHHRRNVAAALTAALALDVPTEVLQPALRSFVGLPHRLQRIHEAHGIQYYDDSYATMPDATIAALESMSGPFHLIVGGSDKGATWEALSQAIAQTNPVTLLVMGQTGPAIASAARAAGYASERIIEVGTLERAMTVARERVQPGELVLLSPASASFDQFKNAGERGDRFAELARTGDA
ncbi:MAG: UDP-N-acetylmuramoyl-L-alanine--D-glutamate ligase [Patescibacteria group bacterium]|jgi:UDP-N-acetylmuramoylalanine--D-glutamate ligase